MNNRKKGVSVGTILTLCLTAFVIVGCIFVFSRMLTENSNARLNAQKMIGLIENALSGQTPAP